MARYVFEAWTNEDRTQVAFWPRSAIDLKRSAFSDMVHLLFSIDADSYEEAMAVYYVRMGFDPYKPQGKPVECPNECGAHYYPEGSGECPICGSI